MKPTGTLFRRRPMSARKRKGTRRSTRKRGKATRARTKRAKTTRGRARTRNPAGTKARGRKRTTATRRDRDGVEDRGHTVALLRDITEHHETGPGASAGDLDADWARAQSSGEEAVGGSVSTPGQDIVDEIGHALGVEQPPTAPLRSSEEILEDRDRRYWDLERRADRKAKRRHEP